MNVKDAAFYAGVLASEECQCGAEKLRRTALCYRCFNSLPTHMKNDLYRKLSDGFEAAYEAAVDWLNCPYGRPPVAARRGTLYVPE